MKYNCPTCGHRLPGNSLVLTKANKQAMTYKAKIGLIDVDGHTDIAGNHFPNLALMKISAYHKSKGDAVEWYSSFDFYDKVYMSKVFTFTPDYPNAVSAMIIHKGGTGYDINSSLPEEIERTCPDYTLYPISGRNDHATAIGFLTRGCIRRCPWCVVPVKEGKIRPNQDIEEFLGGNSKAILLDNNVLASDFGLSQIEKIIRLNIKVDFNQGLDARLITPEIAGLLSHVKWIKRIRLACDKSEDIPVIERTYDLLKKAGYNKEISCYTLIQDFEESHSRLKYLRQYKWFIPHAQPYRDFKVNNIIPAWQSDMARWANKREIYKSCEFKDYQPRKGFFCKEYF